LPRFGELQSFHQNYRTSTGLPARFARRRAIEFPPQLNLVKNPALLIGAGHTMCAISQHNNA